MDPPKSERRPANGGARIHFGNGNNGSWAVAALHIGMEKGSSAHANAACM
jgi:hypothetical protein